MNVFNQYEQLTYPTPVPTVVVEPAYNVDGDLTDDGNWTYTYDGAGRLVAVEPKASPVDGDYKVEYAYDYMNRRVKRIQEEWDADDPSWINPTVTYYLYAGMQCIEELNSSGTVQKRYVWGLDLAGRLDYLDNPFVSFAGAGGVGGLLAVNSPGVTKCYTYDGNGNVLNLVDAAR